MLEYIHGVELYELIRYFGVFDKDTSKFLLA